MSVIEKTFRRKATAQKALIGTNCLLGNRDITEYFIIEDYKQFLEIITQSSPKQFYEHIPANTPVNFFFDIEIYEQKSQYWDDPYKLVDICIETVQTVFPNYTLQKIILEAPARNKHSFHVILRIIDENGKSIMFENVNTLKTLYNQFNLGKYKDSNNKHLIDPSVYRDGLFRTLHSTKSGESRPLVKNERSDPFDDIDAFVCYKHADYVIYKTHVDEVLIPTEVQSIVNVPQALSDIDKQTIIKFVQREYHHFPNKVRDVFIDKQFNCIIIALTEKYCPFVEREHKSNNQYIVIDTCSAKQKCHDTDCKEDRHHEVKLELYPVEISELVKKCLEINQQELALIDSAIIECKNYITENFDQDVTDVSFDEKAMIFRGIVADRGLVKILKGKCPECNIEHQISDGGYCLRCKICNSIFPKNQIIPVDAKYKNLNSFWTTYQIGTVNNIINIYNNTNATDDDFSCDIQLDPVIFKSKEVTNIVNQVLDGHKITMISKLIYTINKKYMYSRNQWYHFNGSVWRNDNDNIEMKKDIMDLSQMFDRIKTHYDSKHKTDTNTMILNKNIKSLINKFHKPGFQDEIIKGAKIYYNDESFINNLNSKKHLVPFTNGVYDLIENKFRKTKKDDYVNLTANFPYDTSVRNPEVYTFLEQVLPNQGVRDFILKKMSECLNGDIPNTYFIMFIGDSGANGKSQLLNLMKLAMGDFGEKVEVTLLTRKRSNANEANTEKMKLMNKRFAFLSEPEDGEKINIGLLKELTGSEEIVARGLYQDAMSFVMEAKLFLACNELPEIKGEDTALWRRIRVVDFPSQFVDEPSAPHEYKIDRSLPSRMREDLSWRQTFINILIDYYTKSVTEPLEVKVKTNEYRQENNDFYNWLEENIEYKKGALFQVKDACQLFLGKTKIHSKESSKYRKEIEKWIKEKYKEAQWKFLCIKFNGQTYKGWKDFQVKSNQADDIILSDE